MENGLCKEKLATRFRENPTIGGKYGIGLVFNYSEVHGLVNTVNAEGSGYDNNFFEFGELYFRDINFEISKKFSKKTKATAKYLNLTYNKDVVQGLVGYGTIKANIFIADVTYRVAKKHSLRLEMQGLWTKDRADEGDWLLALLEYQWSPHMFVAIMNQWNYGNKEVKKRLHYPSITVVTYMELAELP